MFNWKKWEHIMIFLQQVTSNKEPEDTILNRFFDKLSAMCKPWLDAFFMLELSVLTNPPEKKNVELLQNVWRIL